MHISCVGLDLCVHGFMNPMLSWFVCGFFLRRFNILCYASGFYMLLFFCQMFLMRARVCMCVCVCVVQWHYSAQLSMFNMEKRYRNKIIIIIIIIKQDTKLYWMINPGQKLLPVVIQTVEWGCVYWLRLYVLKQHTNCIDISHMWVIFVHVTVYLLMCRHVYVYLYDCFM